MKIHDKVLVVISLAISFVGYYLFNSAETQYVVSRNKSDVIAEVSNYKNNVKLKFNNSFFWNPLNNSQKIYNGDSLLALSNSNATINLLNDSTLEMSENSLIKILKVNEETALEVDKGIISFKQTRKNLKGGAPRGLVINGKKIYAKSNEVEINVQKRAKETLIKVNKGDVSILANNKETKIMANEVLSLEKNKKLALKLISPLNKEFDAQEIKDGVNFRWQDENPTESFLLQLSRQASFKNIIQEESAREKTKVITGLAPGEYYWRVKNEASEEISLMGKFQIKHFAPPSNLKPASYTEFNALPNTKSSIKLSWDGETRDEFHVYLSELATGKTVKFKTQKKSLKVNLKKFGQFAWKVKTAAAGGQFSETHIFEVVPGNDLSSEGNPELVYTGPGNEKISLKWRGQEKEEVVFRLYASENDAKALLEVHTAENRVELNQINPGEYFWDVSHAKFLKVKTQKEKLTVKKRIARLIFPAAKEKVRETKLGEGATFKWEPINDFKGNLVIAKDKDFKQIVKQEAVASNQFNVKLDQSATYYWKLAANEDQIQNFLESSLENRFYFQLKELKKLELPKTIYLRHQRLKGQKGYFVSWDGSQEAVEYEAEIYSDKRMSKLVLKRTLKEAKMGWKYDGSGVYYIRLRYQDKNGDFSPFTSLSKVIYPISPLSE